MDAGIIDVLAVLGRFVGRSDAPPLEWVDLIGWGPDGLECSLDGQATILDVLMALQGFRGTTYFGATGCPAPCPE